MPKLTNNKNKICAHCGSPGLYISYNTKIVRCVEKITQCPGFIAKAKKTRAKPTVEHMKRMSVAGNKRLQELHHNPLWLQTKSQNISESITNRGGHSGENNPMFNRRHSANSKLLQSTKAKLRSASSYENGIKTKIKNGHAIPKENKTDWMLYEEKVDNITRKSWQDYESILNPKKLIRGIEYELDHMFSKLEGFKQGIAPAVIGHHCNLALITRHANRKKHAKCTITVEELILNILSSSRIHHLR